MAPGLVIFDCDGVLVDSEPITTRILSDFLVAHGADMTPEVCAARFVGTSRFAVEGYMADCGTPLPHDWADRFYPLAYEALRTHVTPIPGIRGVLMRLTAAHVPFCVASNGMQEKMRITLGTCGLDELIGEAIFSGYDIGAPKPAPDLFLHAAQSCDVQAANCVVVEDSKSGFQAAARAGMRCLAYCPEVLPDALFGATPFASMSDLPGLLGIET